METSRGSGEQGGQAIGTTTNSFAEKDQIFARNPKAIILDGNIINQKQYDKEPLSCASPLPFFLILKNAHHKSFGGEGGRID